MLNDQDAVNKEPAENTFSSAELLILDARESKRQKTADTLLNILEGRIRNKNTRSAYKTAWRSFFQFCSEFKLELHAVKPYHVGMWLKRHPGVVSTQRQHLAAERIEHHRRTAPRAAGAHFGGQVIFGQSLDPRVERQHQPRARFGHLECERAVKDRMAERIMIEAQHHRLAADQPIVLQLEAGETLAIHPRQPHHRRRR